jgi:hypothetical protein
MLWPVYIRSEMTPPLRLHNLIAAQVNLSEHEQALRDDGSMPD